MITSMSSDSNIKYLAGLGAKALTAIADQACLLEQTLEKCQKCKIETVTVEHKFTHVKTCDRCASENIIEAMYSILKRDVQHSDLDDELLTIANEKNWIDVIDADKIRRITQYIKLTKELDINQNELH